MDNAKEPEIRVDPIVGRMVLVAEGRAQRPGAFVAEAIPDAAGGSCPFCLGSEGLTPEPLAVVESDSPDSDAPWLVRVVPNRYPALTAAPAPVVMEHPLRRVEPAFGSNEVIVESPRHLVSTTQLDDGALGKVFEVYRQRMANAARNPKILHGH
ncbi:MAG: hypothetical protein N2C14_06110, partial [Planctomycetales bacterium]